jgi:hypothetical protein
MDLLMLPAMLLVAAASYFLFFAVAHRGRGGRRG